MPTLEELMKSDPDFAPDLNFVTHKTYPTFESAIWDDISANNPNWTREQIREECRVRLASHYQRLRKRTGQQELDNIVEE